MGKFFLRSLGICIILLLVGMGTALFALFHFGKGLPDYHQLASYQPPIVTRMYAHDGRLFAEYATQKRVFVPIAAIPLKVKQAFLAAEDKNFYSHLGIDFLGVLRASLINLMNMGSNKRPMGASTITQQVAKNFLLSSVSTHVSLDRKIKEAILAFRIESAFSKDQILELYLNEIYLGGGSYGVAAAAVNYFNKSLQDLTETECAFLATLPKAPSRYDPQKDPISAKNRRDWVLARMAEDGFIAAENLKKYQEEPIFLRKPDPSHVVKADFFAEEVRRFLVTKFGETSLYQGGLTVRTTLDPILQKYAEQALKKGLETYDRARGGWRGPLDHVALEGNAHWSVLLQKIPGNPAIVLSNESKKVTLGLVTGEEISLHSEDVAWTKGKLKRGDIVSLNEEKRLAQTPKVNGAIVVIDPHTGRVLALSGGYSYDLSQFNRATQALRQTGSVFKPFVYLTALDQGIEPNTLIDDSPIAIDLGPGLGVYSPQNISKDFMGLIPMRVGLEKSRNLISTRLTAEYIGLEKLAKTVETFGILDKMPLQFSMALGAAETTLLRMTTAYAMIANGGKRLTPFFIDRVQDRTGKTIFAPDPSTCSGCQDLDSSAQTPPVLHELNEQIGDPRSLYQLTSMLEGVVKRGTGARLGREIHQPLAGKTGTSNDYRNAWFIGFSTDLVVGVYVGFDDHSSLGDKQTGGRVALPVALEFFKEALKERPAKPFPIPSGIKLVRVNSLTGQPAKHGDPKAVWEALKENSLETSQEQENEQNLVPDVEKKVDLPPENPLPKEDPSLQGLY